MRASYFGAIVLVCFFEGAYRHARDLTIDHDQPFPNLDVRARPLMYKDVDNQDDWRLLYFVVRVVNREPTRRVALEFDLCEELDFSHVRRGRIRMRFLSASTEQQRGTKALEQPVILEAQTPIEGLLVFAIVESERSGFKFDTDEWFEYVPKDKTRLVLTVNDSISGKSADFPVREKWGVD